VSRLIIVDDEPEVSETLDHALSRYGHESRIARTALGAMKLMRQGVFDAALLDVRLGGGLSGIELAWKIREKFPTLKIMIFSAIHHGPEIAREIKALKATFFVKPVSVDAIVLALDEEQ
jgi:DNA-binding NtrC family response regulator